ARQVLSWPARRRSKYSGIARFALVVAAPEQLELALVEDPRPGRFGEVRGVHLVASVANAAASTTMPHTAFATSSNPAGGWSTTSRPPARRRRFNAGSCARTRGWSSDLGTVPQLDRHDPLRGEAETRCWITFRSASPTWSAVANSTTPRYG